MSHLRPHALAGVVLALLAGGGFPSVTAQEAPAPAGDAVVETPPAPPPACADAWGFLVRLEVRASRFESWSELLADVGATRDSTAAAALLHAASRSSVALESPLEIEDEIAARTTQAAALGRIWGDLVNALADSGHQSAFYEAVARGPHPLPPGFHRDEDGELTPADLGRLLCLEFEDAAARRRRPA